MMPTKQSVSQQTTGGLERTRYFQRQLITPDDLTQDQIYFREKSRRHNRMMHGWGVVCGAWVRPGEDACTVVVEPGYLLGPQGDEIAIDQEVTVDICREDADGNAVAPCGDAVDIWCSDVRANRRADAPLYLAVRYAECLTRPVRAMPGGCGCDETDCEYSRIRDSYVFKLLTRLPETYNPMPAPGINVNCRDQEEYRRYCPPCPESPWVILAVIRINSDGTLAQEEGIDNVSLRRYVVSFADSYISCNRDPQDPNRPLPGVAVQPSRGTLTVAEVAVNEMLDSNGMRLLESNLANDVARAGELPAASMRGVGDRSVIGRAIGDMTINDVADMDLDEFIEAISTDEMSENDKENIRRRAPELHRRAARIAEVTRTLRG